MSALWTPGERVFQAKGTMSAKVLRLMPPSAFGNQQVCVASAERREGE